MPVGALGVFEDLTDGFFEIVVLVRALESFPVVVERRSGEFCDREQQGEGMVRLEVLDSSNFQRRSCDLKARNFPRYATSARSRSFSARSVSNSPSSGASRWMDGGRPRRFGRSPSSPSRR